MGAAADAVMLRWRSRNATAQSRRRPIETAQRQRRRRLAAFGRDAQGVAASVSTEAVVLRKDFVQAVETPTSGYVEAEIVFGDDGEISIWVPPGGGGGGGGGTTYFPGGWT